MKSINKTKNDSISEQASVTKEEMIEFASKYKNIEAFKDFDDETTYWFIMLFILLMYIDYNTQKLWESFAEEVKTKNRFFPESELLKKISDIAEKATCTISKGDILYRARDYTKQDFFKNDMVIALSEIMKDEFSNLEFDATDIFNESAMNIASIYLSATGTNVLLFDVDAKTRVYDITGSKVYTVNTLDIDISQVMPMENEDKEQPQMLFICYPKCSTCQKAKKWLDEHNIKYTERHIVEVNPTYDELKEWYGKSGLTLKKFFNTSGLLYKEMQLKDKLPTMSEEEQIQLLATNGMLVKRPLVVNGDTVLVGFKEAEWAEKLN